METNTDKLVLNVSRSLAAVVNKAHIYKNGSTVTTVGFDGKVKAHDSFVNLLASDGENKFLLKEIAVSEIEDNLGTILYYAGIDEFWGPIEAKEIVSVPQDFNGVRYVVENAATYM